MMGVNAHQSGMTESAKNDGSLCRITSTPTHLSQRQAKAKLFRVKKHGLTRLEVATRKETSCAFLSEPRAAFYTEKQGKKQNKNAHSSTAVRKNCQGIRQANERFLKKNWHSGETLT
ncbi:MAG: hypothetical protein ACRCWW_21815 [Scandinavium sp.]|uniref:hypothetical protein n=1 Tax=Scandinavium sp. TaxID=2830653 RepID=UPI003F3DEE3A